MTAVRRHDPDRSRAAILDAAETLFLKHGFAGTSMSEIARSSSVTKSLIHHHFGSKEALWEEVKRTRFTTYYDRQIALLTQMQADAQLIEASMAVYFNFLRDNPQVVRLLWWMALSDKIEAGEMMEELRDLGVARIRKAQEAGALRDDIAPQYIFIAFLGLVHVWFSEAPWAAPEDDAGAYLTAAWKMFAAGVLPPGRG
jgi:TetR/AcrR family transcriptional regulator